MKNEVKLGILSIIILSLFTWMMIVLGDVKFKKETYTVPVIFPYVGGLDIKSSVRLAGVKIGEVTIVELRDGIPYVEMEIDRKVHIKKDAKITINTLGFIGSNYIEIDIGSPESEFYGEEFTEPLKGEAPLNVGDIMNLINDVSRKFNEIGDSITSLSEEIQEILQENKAHISTTMENLSELSLASRDLVVKLNALSNQLNTTANNLNKFYEENSSSLSSTIKGTEALVTELNEVSRSIKDIAYKIEHGEGTIGKVVSDDKLYNDLNQLVSKSNDLIEKVNKVQTYWEYEGLYNENSEVFDSKIGLKISPEGNNSYVISVSNLGRENEDLKLDLLLNYRISNLTLFGGMLESSAGFGAYYQISPALQFYAAGLNFEREDLNPNIRCGLSLKILKGFHLYAEGSDLMEEAYYRAGLRLSLEDTNIKYIFGFLGLTGN
ncbi:MAG TPA: MCE family protein [Firmicutes bacterium]|nr:MCE family protein [Bacillota bacterium]